MSASKLTAYTDTIKNEKSKSLLEKLYKDNPTAGSIYDLDISAADSAHAAGKTQLDTSLAEGKAALEKNKTAQKRAASYSYAKLMSYLPEQLKAQGLHGQGVSQSALLSAYGNYRNAVAGVDADHADRVSKLEAAYKTDLAGLDATRDAAHHTALQNYVTRADDSVSRSALNERVMEDLEVKFVDAEISGDYTSAAKRLAELKDFLDEDTYNYFASVLPGAYKSTIEGTAEEIGKEQSEQVAPGGAKTNGVVLDNEISGNASVLSQIFGCSVFETQTAAIKSILTESAQWGSEKNGTKRTVKVGGRKNKGGIVGQRTVTLVFHDGKWYESE